VCRLLQLALKNVHRQWHRGNHLWAGCHPWHPRTRKQHQVSTAYARNGTHPHSTPPASDRVFVEGVYQQESVKESNISCPVEAEEEQVMWIDGITFLHPLMNDMSPCFVRCMDRDLTVKNKYSPLGELACF
jgi:hypothetical protein